MKINLPQRFRLKTDFREMRMFSLDYAGRMNYNITMIMS